MNIEDLKNMYDNFVIIDGEDYWKLVILEHLINNFEEKNINNLNITEEKINNMVYNIMGNEDLWQEIDYTIENVIEIEQEIEQEETQYIKNNI